MSEDVAANNHDAAAEHEAVSLALFMPGDRAKELVIEIDQRKQAREPAAVAVNVMDIMAVSTTQSATDLPPAFHRFTVGKPPTWWGLCALDAVIFAGLGYGSSMLHQPYRGIVSVAIWAAFGWARAIRMGPVRWRWRKEPRTDKPTATGGATW